MHKEKNFDFDNDLLTEALTDLQLAKNFFNNASTPDMVDAAISRLSAAEMHLRDVIRKVRNCNVDNND